MKLEYIKTDKCPVGGCGVVIEETVEPDRGGMSIRRHANGGAWEERVFACGCRVSYCPNFRAEEIKGRCRNDPKYIEMMKKREAAKQELYSVIKSLDTDDEYKKRLDNAITYV